MQEFKREKNTLESRVKEMTKATAFHQDHLRAVDAWFKQVRNIPEIRQDQFLMCDSTVDR